MARKFRFIIVLLFIFLLLPLVFAFYVTRTISSSVVNAGDLVDVSLDVSLDGGEQYYILRDSFPIGWIVSDPGVGSIGSDGIWRVSKNSPVGLNKYTYQLKVPLGVVDNTYLFSGDYSVINNLGVGSSGVISGSNSISVNGGQQTSIYIQPSSKMVSSGSVFNVDIYVSKVVNLYGVQFDLSFDNSVINFVSIVKNTAFLGSDGANVIDSSSGSLGNLDLSTPGLINDYVVLRSGTSLGISGSGKIATITFQALNGINGFSNLLLSGTILSDPSSFRINHGVLNGKIDVGYCGDSIVQSTLGEDCDDGNNIDGDGCSSDCRVVSCNSLGGSVCDIGQICPSNSLHSADSDRCCDSVCVAPSWISCSQCGNGVFNACDRLECNSITEGCYFIENDNPLTFWVVEGNCGSCSSVSSCSDYGGDMVSCEGNSCGLSLKCGWDSASKNCVNIDTEINCNNGIDDDGDGNIDCVDSDCTGKVGPLGNVCCVSSIDCDDRLFCNGNEFCGSNGECSNGVNPILDDGVSCTVDSCDEVNDVVINTPDNSVCSGLNNQCNVGVCDVVSGCNTQPSNEGGSCTDGLFCTTGDNCKLGVCQGGSLASCPVGEYCDSSSDKCLIIPECVVDSDCDDGNSCTKDSCVSGSCKNNPSVLDGSSCDDGLFCTTVGSTSCSGGVCGGGSQTCGTLQYCNELTDSCDECSSDVSLVNVYCDDEVACTTESCNLGVCSSDKTSCGCDILDLNTDGVVDLFDLRFVALESTKPSPNIVADINKDGSDNNGDGIIDIPKIDINDLVMVAIKINIC